MTQLLVSVRDAEEAAIALLAGADVIDLKEPSAGSLGAVCPQVAAEVAECVDAERPLSIALGELFLEESRSLSIPSNSSNPTSPIDSRRPIANNFDPRLLARFTYVKIGLAAAQRQPNWRQRWLEWARHLPATINPVVACYVDAAAESPCPNQIIQFASENSIRTVLFDTYQKKSGGGGTPYFFKPTLKLRWLL